MGCACKGRKNETYVWVSDDGTRTKTFDNEIVVKAKVRRIGGSYTTVPGN